MSRREPASPAVHAAAEWVERYQKECQERADRLKEDLATLG